jgi:hypothetical protein
LSLSWLPWSEWWISPSTTPRRQTASSSALIANAASACSPIACPTATLEQPSTTATRYNVPWSVGSSV